MDWKLELVPIPVADVDRAKAFYTEKLGFKLDHDVRNGELRVVQLTPPGSACSIVIGTASCRRRRTRCRACIWSCPTCTRRVRNWSSGAWRRARSRTTAEAFLSSS